MAIDPILETAIDLMMQMLRKGLLENKAYQKELMDSGSVKIASMHILEPENKKLKIVVSVSYD